MYVVKLNVLFKIVKKEKKRSRFTVYRHKGAYRVKAAFPEPYPPEKEPIS